MAQSKTKKKLFNIAYNIGASIVILGALFKLNHISFGPLNGSSVLAVGLIAEAIIFFLSAFESVEDDLDWSKVYPELGEDGIISEQKEKIGAEGMLSQKLDALLLEASSKQTALNTAVVENTERLKVQMESLAKNLSSLNGVYGNMLSAMSSK